MMVGDHESVKGCNHKGCGHAITLHMCHSFVQRTATTAVVELCPGSILGDGFQLLIGLAEIHVPRMWVEEDEKEHCVRRGKGGRERGEGWKNIGM